MASIVRRWQVAAGRIRRTGGLLWAAGLELAQVPERTEPGSSTRHHDSLHLHHQRCRVSRVPFVLGCVEPAGLPMTPCLGEVHCRPVTQPFSTYQLSSEPPTPAPLAEGTSG